MCNTARPGGGAGVDSRFLSTPYPKRVTRVGIPLRFVTSQVGGVHRRLELFFGLRSAPLEKQVLGSEILGGEGYHDGRLWLRGPEGHRF